ncbi:hypothetical protein KJA15_03930 [Patescibacteria group bacterium]|nr:hypothetical protein [Patescibacteria group bacterium]
MEDIPKIFQVFNLDSERMEEISPEELPKLNLPEAGQRLIQELKAKGHEVFVSSVKTSGLPKSLLVSDKVPPEEHGAKADFFEIAGDLLGLGWYESGEVYSDTR